MKNFRFNFLILLLLSISFGVHAQESRTVGKNLPVQWPQSLFETPKTFPAPKENDAEGVKSIFLEGPSYKGKPTRIFAYYGIPEKAKSGKVSAMVLVHGGGGTAFPEWVKLWNSRGYAAIAMDNCGSLPGGTNLEMNRPRHEFSGPSGWGNFGTSEETITDQWPYHAVSAVIVANSFLRSLPEVDSERIGITGISWGGYLTCLAAAVDNRYKFAAPVYGCGFLGVNSVWTPELNKLGETGKKWLSLWDPEYYLPNINFPTLWLNGTNDFAYPMDSFQKSYRLPIAAHTICIRARMKHAHGGPGENPEEILAFAENITNSGPALVKITGQGRDKDRAWVTFESRTPVRRAELLLTKDKGPWQNRKWETLSAYINSETKTVTAILPRETTVYYINLIDRKGLVVSSEHEEIK